MERIKFIYERADEFNEGVEEMNICMQIKDKNDEGLLNDTVCSIFVQFMDAVGFSHENILKYFIGDDVCNEICCKQ